MKSIGAKIGIVTVSDRVCSGEYEDRGGPAIRDYLEEVLVSPWVAVPKRVPDEEGQIAAVLAGLADCGECCLVITTGGTGPALRDVTPEATASVVQKVLPGFGERMRAASLATVPTAILSRQMAGIRGSTLIINLPGSPKAVGECLDAVFGAVPDCIDLLGGPSIEVDPRRVQAYRAHRSKPSDRDGP